MTCWIIGCFFTAVDTIEQIRKNLKKTVQKYDNQTNNSIASHPISTVRAFECFDHNDILNADSTGDSRFDEFCPVTKTSTTAPTPKPKPRHHMNSDADYVNCVSAKSHCQKLCSSEAAVEGMGYSDTHYVNCISTKSHQELCSSEAVVEGTRYAATQFEAAPRVACMLCLWLLDR